MKTKKNAPTRIANSDQGATKGLSNNFKGTTPRLKIKQIHTSNIFLKKYLGCYSTPVNPDPVNPIIIRELLKLFSDLSDVAVITKYAQPETGRDIYETV